MKSSLRRLIVASSVFLCQCVWFSFSPGATARAASMPAFAAGPDSQITATAAANSVMIPGPLRSFLRMAGISQQVSPEEVLPLLARNVYLRGYDSGAQTVFLTLIDRYVHQARELQILAGSTNTIRVDGCDDRWPIAAICEPIDQRSSEVQLP